MGVTSGGLLSGGLTNAKDFKDEPDQPVKIKTAIAAIERNSWEVCENIEKYGIDSSTPEGQEALTKIVEVALQNGKGVSVARNIHKFKIKSEEVLIKFANIVVTRNTLEFFENVENFGINFDTPEGEKLLEEVVDTAIKSGLGIAVSKNIHKFKIKSESIQIKIAKVIAEKNAWELCENIENFGINFNTLESEKALEEIIEIALKNERGEAISKNIQKFKIQPEELRIKIAKRMAAGDGAELSEYIKNYEIDSNTKEGQIALKNIIEIVMKNGNARAISQNIKNFDIKSEKALLEIIMLIVQENPSEVCEGIKNFNIDFNTEKNQKILIEIIEIAIQKSLDGKDVPKNIHKFGIKSEDVRIRIAKMAAAQHPRMASLYIKNFGIDHTTTKGQEVLIEIAKIAATNDGGCTSELIKNYQINSDTEERKKDLIEIAKIAVTVDLQKTLLFIKNYGINPRTFEGQRALIEVAQTSAAFNGGKTSKYIKNFMIDSHSPEGKIALIKIAKIAAAQSGKGTLEYIKNFEIDTGVIEERKALKEIIEIALKQNVIKTSQILKNYLDNDLIFDAIPVTDLTETLLDSALFQLHTFTINEFKKTAKALRIFFNLDKEVQLLRLFDKNISLDVAFVNFNQLCKKQQLDPSFISWVNTSYSLIKKGNDKRKFLEWIISFTAFSSVSQKTTLVMQNPNLLNSIRTTTPWIRDLLTKELLAFYADSNDKKSGFLQMFRDKCKEGANGKIVKTPPVHTEVPSLFFAEYPEESHKACLDAIERIKGQREFFRRKDCKKILFETLLRIKNAPLSPNEKKCLIKELFLLDGQQFLEACRFVKNLIAFEKFTYFQNLEKNGTTENGLVKDLENGLSDFFKKTFQSHVDNFGQKYTQTFENWRGIHSLITYAGKMNSLYGLEKEEALRLLKKFITSILNNDFQIKRYVTHNYPHMLLVKNEASEVFEKWQNNLNLEPSEIMKVDEEEIISISDEIKNQLLTGLSKEHLGTKQLYPHIEQFLHDSSKLNSYVNNISRVLTSIDEKRNVSENKTMSKEDIKLKKRLLIEKNILELFALDDISRLESGLQALKIKIPRNNTFRKKDIEACLNLLTISNPEVVNFTVVESDHPNDFLLMGTDVESSCLNINEAPYFSKCVLDTAWDGKSKLLLIKDKHGNILARAIIKLLLDENDKPVLFMEQVYTFDDNPLYIPNLVKLALKKARDLGIPLVTTYSYSKELVPFGSPVFAKEKPGTFEYVDSLASIESRSYSIESVNEIIE